MEGKKAEEYLEILYPGNNNPQEEHYFEKEYNKQFVENNIDEINKYYKRFVENKDLYGDEWQELTDVELMKKAIDEAKTRYYYNVLNPEIEFEKEYHEYGNLTEDIDFIYIHLYEIEEEYIELLKTKEEKYKNWEDKELLEIALRIAKGNNYFKLLHPEYDKIEKEPEYELKVSKDLEFIFENLEEIDREYRKAVKEKLKEKENIDVLTKTEIIITVLNMVKSRILSEAENQKELEKEQNENYEINKNRPEEGIEELLSNVEIEEEQSETENTANEYDIVIPTKQVIGARDIASADMKAVLTSDEVTRKEKFFAAILNKIKMQRGR